MGTDWRRRPGRVLSVLREIDADVVALQEIDRRFGSRATSLTPQLIAEHTDYRLISFATRQNSVGWHGNALLVRREITVLKSQRIALPALEPRGAVQADLVFADVALRVVGVHLGLLGIWRKRQARTLLDYLERQQCRRPTIIMGDMNEWSAHGGCIAEFKRDHIVAATGASFHSNRPVSALDRIITSPDVRIEAAGAHYSQDARVASDHLPVWALLDLPHPPERTPFVADDAAASG